ncbi:MAG: alpha/beta hydrolase [Geminicoccales bacterium]
MSSHRNKARRWRDGAAVMEGVVAPAPTTPRDQLSLYQADLHLQQRGLEYQRAQLGENPHPRSPNAGKAAAIDRELARLAERQELVETVSRPDLATGVAPEILHFDPKDDGQIVVAHGDIRNASHIAVMVPGMTTDLENFNAIDGAPVFSDFLDALPKDAETHVLAHSYGSLLIGKALAEGAKPEYAHIFSSPGIGVDALDELNLEGSTVVTVTSNPGDSVVTFGPFGDMPPEGAISYPAMGNPPPEDSPEADDYEPHIDYF